MEIRHYGYNIEEDMLNAAVDFWEAMGYKARSRTVEVYRGHTGMIVKMSKKGHTDVELVAGPEFCSQVYSGYSFHIAVKGKLDKKHLAETVCKYKEGVTMYLTNMDIVVEEVI